MVKTPNEFGGLSNEELEDFEKVNQISLPEKYKEFLLKYNGGKPLKEHIENSSVVVTYIFGMHNGDYHASLYKHIEMFKGRLPFSTFPIAGDAFGNLFIMSLHPEGHGHIYFWDHEVEPAYQNGHFTDNCTFIAYSFESFLDKLH